MRKVLSILLILSIVNQCFSFGIMETISEAKNGKTNTVYFEESDEYIVNPYMGNVSSAVTKTRIYDGLLVFGQASWSTIEATKGVYALDTFEKNNNYNYWTKVKNNKFILSFNMDWPDKSLGRDLPDWLYSEIKQEALNNYTLLLNNATTANDAAKISEYNNAIYLIQHDQDVYDDFVSSGKEKVNIPGVGTYYSYYVNTEKGKERRGGFSPNYSSKVLIDAHQKLMKALGERYDNPDKVYVISMASLGHWGEMHTTYLDIKDVGRYPNEEIAKLYENEYALNFNHIMVSSRYPRDVAKENGFGLHNHGLGSASQTYDWFMDYYEDGYTNYATGEEYPAMPDFWKTAPSGAEILYVGDMRFFYDENVNEIIQQAKDTHVSYFHEETKSTEEVTKNVEKLLSEIGYRFVLERATYDVSGKQGGTIELITNWSNRGVAPFYFEWPIIVELRSKASKVVASKIIETDISNLIPGNSKMYKTLIDIPSNLTNGDYELYIGIFNPKTNKAEVKLATTVTSVKNMYKLGTVQINGTESNLESKMADLKSLTIYGSDVVNVYPGDTTSRYSVVARNQSLQSMSLVLEWYVKDNDKVSINQNGVLTIKGGTTEGSFIVGARIKDNTDFYVEKIVELSKAKTSDEVMAEILEEVESIKIYGSSSLKVSSKDSTSSYLCVVRNDVGEELDVEVKWYIDGSSAASVDQNGLVTVKGNTSNGSFILGAKVVGKEEVLSEMKVELYGGK